MATCTWVAGGARELNLALHGSLAVPVGIRVSKFTIIFTLYLFLSPFFGFVFFVLGPMAAYGAKFTKYTARFYVTVSFGLRKMADRLFRVAF